MSKRAPFELLGNSILPGKTARLSIEVAKLHTNTPIQVPVIISHSRKEGPTLLLLAGVHGDEINGVEAIRRFIRNGYHKPTRGTVICIPVFNIFGFLNVSREFPDGRDLNRMFPGTKNGSLASQFAYIFMKEIAPLVDVVIDFHTGGSQRFNYPQTRCQFDNKESKELCEVFGAPYTIHSPLLPKSVRQALTRQGKRYVLFEGGKANSIDDFVVESAINGIQRIMSHLNIRDFEIANIPSNTKIIKVSKWIRASRSGMLHVVVKNGSYVEKGTILSTISDPYGKYSRSIRAPFNGVIFNVNETPLVNKGDALFNIGKISENDAPKEGDAELSN